MTDKDNYSPLMFLTVNINWFLLVCLFATKGKLTYFFFFFTRLHVQHWNLDFRVTIPLAISQEFAADEKPQIYPLKPDEITHFKEMSCNNRECTVCACLFLGV